MRIQRAAIRPLTPWHDVEPGETFIERPGGIVYLKVAKVTEAGTDDCLNAVILETGEFASFVEECGVYVVRSELTVEE